MGSGFRTGAGAKCAETSRSGSQLDGREVACVIYLFSSARKIPAFSSPWKELQRGRFMSKAFKFVQFLQAFEGGRLSEALQADPSPLAETPASASGQLLDRGDDGMGSPQFLVEKPDF